MMIFWLVIKLTYKFTVKIWEFSSKLKLTLKYLDKVWSVFARSCLVTSLYSQARKKVRSQVMLTQKSKDQRIFYLIEAHYVVHVCEYLICKHSQGGKQVTFACPFTDHT